MGIYNIIRSILLQPSYLDDKVARFRLPELL